MQRDEYLLLFVRCIGQMQNCINNNVSSYKGVEKWAKLYFRGCSNSTKIVVVPLIDCGHWSVFILNDIMTLHLDFMHGIHRHDVIEYFVRAIGFCWEPWCEGYTKVFACFVNFMGKQIVTPSMNQ
jgi:hypothetical protein